MSLRLYQVDAFTDAVFAGNPAAVCPLDAWLPDRVMQAIAAENNLSETAFFVAQDDGFALRWFTPAVEVDLCGHATLASAFVIMTRLQPHLDRVVFRTRVSGDLIVERQGDRYTMDFPRWPADPMEPPDVLANALGASPGTVYSGPDWMAIFDGEATVRAIRPDFAALAQLPCRGLIVTAPGDDVDFVSRFFAPAAGIDEDPVTGSAHCMLAPYWGARLGKDALIARQVSRRGGEIHCRLAGDRVMLAGGAALYLEGEIHV